MIHREEVNMLRRKAFEFLANFYEDRLDKRMVEKGAKVAKSFVKKMGEIPLEIHG